MIVIAEERELGISSGNSRLLMVLGAIGGGVLECSAYDDVINVSALINS